jgi:hypothetical protein
MPKQLNVRKTEKPEIKPKPEIKQKPDMKQEPKIKQKPEIKLTPEINQKPEVKQKPKIKQKPEIKPKPKLKRQERTELESDKGDCCICKFIGGLFYMASAGCFLREFLDLTFFSVLTSLQTEESLAEALVAFE